MCHYWNKMGHQNCAKNSSTSDITDEELRCCKTKFQSINLLKADLLFPSLSSSRPFPPPSLSFSPSFHPPLPSFPSFLPFPATLDSVYVVGSLDEALSIRGFRYHLADIEATVVRCHKSVIGRWGLSSHTFLLLTRVSLPTLPVTYLVKYWFNFELLKICKHMIMPWQAAVEFNSSQVDGENHVL